MFPGNKRQSTELDMKALRHTGIVVSNLDKALYFYGDILGLKIKREMIESGKYIDNVSGLKEVRVKTIKMSADDGNLIELLHYKSHPRKPINKDICDIGCSHIAFTVESLDYEYKRLREKGVRFSCAPQISPGGKAKVAFCHDPEGNLIELVEELT